ncbi:MAG: hypothetical protein JEZ09_10825 [Salinivirgaceae bacterium]|nr:hypothetical protein [Salinivirgaceae bacterium]
MKLRFIHIIGILLIQTISYSQISNSNHLLLTKTLNQNSLFQKSIEYINSLPENEITTEILFQKSVSFYGIEDIKTATNIALEIFKSNPEMVSYHLAKCYAKLNKPEIACKYLEEHLNQKEKKQLNQIKTDKAFYSIENSDAWKELWRKKEYFSKYDLMLEDALFEYKTDNLAESLEMLNKITNIRTSMHLAFYYESILYEKNGDIENALKSISEALLKDDENPNYYLQKSFCELKANKAKKALKSIETAINLDNSQIDFYFHRARVLVKLEQPEKAIEDLTLIENLIDNNSVHLLASEVYFEAKIYQKALIALNKCIKNEMHNPQLYIQRAAIYMAIYAYDFAEKDYSMILDFMPYNGEIYYNRGIARIKQNKYEMACSDFNKAYSFQFMQAEDAIKRYCQKYSK